MNVKPLFFLEEKQRKVLPNILGNKSFPVYTYEWKAIAVCEDREELEKELKNLDKNFYRITSNDPYLR